MRYHLADVGTDVWIGDWNSCDQLLDEYDLSIHIWRDENVIDHMVCKRVLKNIQKGLVVKYREKDPLNTASLSLREIAYYASQDGKLLVHCAGGVCRSATLALVSKMSRGCDKFRAIDDIYRGMWDAYRTTPELYNYIVKDIFEFFEDHLAENRCLM